MNRLIACDFDGTLFDTSYANYQSYSEALSQYGYSLSYDCFKKICDGRSYKDFLPKIVSRKDYDIITEIHDYKVNNYSKYYSSIVPNRHLLKIVEQNQSDAIIAIVTTATKQSVSEILSRFHVERYFDFIVAKEDVNKIKPDPEGYIYAMKIANSTTSSTTIFEDSKIGLQAAMRSGANVVVVKPFSSDKEYKKISLQPVTA